MDDGEPSPPFTLEEFFETLNAGNALVDPTTEILSSPSDVAAPDYTPAPGGPAASGCTTPDSTFFESVTYQGGVDPTEDWTLGWTTHALN
jgi:hypothetical protein